MERVASILLVLSVVSAAAAGSGATDAVLRLPSDGNGNVNDDEMRPWDCCNVAVCTRSMPPTCRCLDLVEKCSDNCLECAGIAPGQEACLDWYKGAAPPKCDKQSHTVVVNGVVKKGDAESPPWKCCDRAVPGPSTKLTPVWYCMDKFEHCDCERCVKVEAGNSYFCLDEYKGRDPGPSCSHHG